MSTIFITEKPSVAQEYRKVLKVQSSEKTDGYIEGFSSVMKTNVIITWAVGHLISICTPEEQNEEWGGKWSRDKLPMIPQTFKYKPLKDTYKQFKIVRSLYTRKDIDCIYYAGDSGREGIYIQALIRNQIFKTAPKGIDERVIWIDSYTEASILNGIKTAKSYSDYQPMIDSGYARAISDWLIGMNFTEGFTLTSGTLVNVGRVMTPTLAMIVQRQQEIDSFTKTYSYGVKADNFSSWKAVKGSKFFESDLLYNDTGFMKETDAKELAGNCNASGMLTVESVKVKTKTEYAPYLFNLADLQAYCSKAFKISPNQSLEIAQSLYEKKFTTYPRTDSRFLSGAVSDDLKKQGYNIPPRYVDDSKVTDHYAIIPTFHGDADTLSGYEAKVYAAILKRFTDTMKPPFIYDAVSVVYVHTNNERFFETFRLVKQKGFKEKIEGDDISEKSVPKKGDTVKVNSFNVYNMETRPPVPYTTGSLILAMEKAGRLIEDEELREQIKTCGIGTSATRAAIIEKLKDKKLITVDNSQKVAPTDFGKAVIPIIAEYDETLISPVKTADFEMHLNAIADGSLSREEYISEISTYVETTVKNILATNTSSLSSFNSKSSEKPTGSHKCPCCDAILKYGRYDWYCDCKFSFGLEVCGHKMKESDLDDLIRKGKTKTYSFKNKTGKRFRAKLIVNKTEHKTAFEFDNSSSEKSAKSESSTGNSTWGQKKSTPINTGWGKKKT